MKVLSFVFCVCVSVFRVAKCDTHPIETYDNSGSIGNPLVVHGTNPYQVAILRRLQFNFDILDGLKFVCGGSLIAQQWVLTAAQCVEDPNLKLLLGASNIRSYENFQISFDVTQDNMRIHPNYQKGTFDNDVALIKLPRALKYNVHIQPVALADANEETYVGKTVFLSGWGRTSPFAPVADYLKQTQLKVMDNKECQTRFTLSFVYISCHHMCTNGGVSFSEIGSCSADSGAPLIYLNPNTSRQEQVGIVSRTVAKCDASAPTIYTKIAPYKVWIERVLRLENMMAMKTDRHVNKTTNRIDVLRKEREEIATKAVSHIEKQVDMNEEKLKKQIRVDEINTVEVKETDDEPNSTIKEVELDTQAKEVDDEPNSAKKQVEVDGDETQAKQTDEEPNSETKQADTDPAAKQADDEENETQAKEQDEEPNSENKQIETNEATDAQAKETVEEPIGETKQVGADPQSKEVDEQISSQNKEVDTDPEAKQVDDNPNDDENEVDAHPKAKPWIDYPIIENKQVELDEANEIQSKQTDQGPNTNEVDMDLEAKELDGEPNSENKLLEMEGNEIQAKETDDEPSSEKKEVDIEPETKQGDDETNDEKEVDMNPEAKEYDETNEVL